MQYYYNYHNEELGNENQSIHLSDTLSLDVKTYFCGLIVLPATCLDAIDPYTSRDITIKSERHDLEFNYTLNLKNFRLITGTSARLDIVSADNVFRDNNTLYHKLYRGFAHGEYRLHNDWLFNAGFMVENNDISGTDFSPRVSILRHINKNHTLRLGASRATRTPTLYDQNAYNVIETTLTENGGQVLSAPLQALLGGTDVMTSVSLISNGNIQSEEIKSIELGYIARLLNNRLTLDIKLFKDNTDNLIGETGGGSEATVLEDNVGGEADEVLNMFKTETEGTEIALDYKLAKDYRIYTHYTYIDISAETFESRSNPRDIRRLTVSAPKKTFGLTLIKHWPEDLDASINYYQVSDMDWLDRTGSTYPGGPGDRSAQAYKKMDLKLSKQYNTGNKKLKLSRTLLNGLDDFFDYNRTRYTDNTLTTVYPSTNTLNSYGSIQDMRAYLEISLEFN